MAADSAVRSIQTNLSRVTWIGRRRGGLHAIDGDGGEVRLHGGKSTVGGSHVTTSARWEVANKRVPSKLLPRKRLAIIDSTYGLRCGLLHRPFYVVGPEAVTHHDRSFEIN